jgi:hypothetical protein
MSKPTNSTLAELDAAVEAQRMQVMAWGPHPAKSARCWVMADDVSALIAAAEARGAARAEARECVGEVRSNDHAWTYVRCDGSVLGGPLSMPAYQFCVVCGGRVRVEGANNE